MNKKQIVIFSIFSALIISGFGIASVMAASAGTTNTNLTKTEQFQKMFGITLTPEQQTQIDAKQKEMETKKADELAKWQAMTLDSWKQQETAKINATTQAQFDAIKQRTVNMLQNTNGHMGRFDKGAEKPAE